jgi:hypothetical protein
MSQDSSGEAAHGSSRSSLPGRSRDRRQNRGGRGHNRGKSVREQTLEGRVPELKGAVYDLTIERNPDQYLKMTKEIITFMASRCTSYTTELIEGLQKLQITDPQAPTDPDPTDPIAVEKWKIALRQHINRMQVYKNFRSSLYNLALGQCSEVLQDKLKSHHDFSACNQDGIGLLSIIKALTHSFEDQLFLPDATATVVREFYGQKQRESESLQAYHDRYLAQVQVLVVIGVSIAPSTVGDFVADKNGRRAAATDADVTEAKERYLAICFLQSVNNKYSSYLDHLRNSFLDGQEILPSTLHQAYNILQRRSMGATYNQLEGGDGVAFAQESIDGHSKSHITCFQCGQRGHYANECPTRNEQQVQGSKSLGGWSGVSFVLSGGVQRPSNVDFT